MATTIDFIAPLGAVGSVGGNPVIQLGSGAMTFEPGGQAEYATPVMPTLPKAVELTIDLWQRVSGLLDGGDARIFGAGIDPRNDAADIDLQLSGPRYVAMDRYMAKRGPWGRVMMRNTTSVQVSLDLSAANELRPVVANLLAPLIVATFANSHTPVAANTRTYAWQHLDETRTGVFDLRNTSLSETYSDFALDADVMMFWSGDEAQAGEPGFSFKEWIEAGHPAYGHPTHDDLEYHLTTLFPEVRLRNGVMEIRSIDGRGLDMISAPLTLVTGALYDEPTTRKILGCLDEGIDDLNRMWRLAATEGLDNPVIAELASRIWPIALDGAITLGIDDRYIEDARAFLE